MQQNCSVNLSGKKGHGIELDGFVESEVVQPLKKYASGHTTVTMCERLMASLNCYDMHTWERKGLMCITLHGIASKHPFLIRLREPGSVFERGFSLVPTARR